MTVRSRRRALALALALTASAGACGVPTDSSPEVLSDADVPDGLKPVEAPVTEPAAVEEDVDVWFLREGMLVSVRHRVAAPVDPAAAIAELLAGPSEDEQGQSLRSAIPDSSAVVGVTVARGVAAVSLAPEFAEIPASDQVLAVAQLVFTLTDLRGVGRVRFLVDDVQVAVPLPTGESTDESVSRDEYVALLPGATGSTVPPEP